MPESMTGNYRGWPAQSALQRNYAQRMHAFGNWTPPTLNVESTSCSSYESLISSQNLHLATARRKCCSRT